MASGSQDCTVKLWDTSSGLCLHTLKGIEAISHQSLSHMIQNTSSRLQVIIQSGHGTPLADKIHMDLIVMLEPVICTFPTTRRS